MTAQRTILVGVPNDDATSRLLSDIDSGALRAAKSDPADRSDIERLEALSVQLERRAASLWISDSAPSIELESGSPALRVATRDQALGGAVSPPVRAQVESWVDAGLAAVSVCLPLEPGTATAPGGAGVPARPPVERWASPDGARGRRAVEQRFRSQLERAVGTSAAADQAPPVISPSGIQNAVVTEILREFVDESAATQRVDAAVEYRDGSRSAHRFPLACLRLADEPSAEADLELKFAMLSVRHTEMDAAVHGAWLRNAEISRPRPAAQTDDMVYMASRAQLSELTDGGARRVLLHMYQTGLETAVVGFYRAVVVHLLEHPRSLVVIPMYFQGAPHGGSIGRSGRNARRGRSRGRRVTRIRAPFRRGTPWAT